MRARNIKPGFYLNEALAECSITARYIWPGLWMAADREGRFEDRPKRLKAAILPFDNADFPALMDELEAQGLIVRYEVDGEKYVWIPKFKEHQKPHKNEQASKLPPCPAEENSTTLVVPKHNLGSAKELPKSETGNNQGSAIAQPKQGKGTTKAVPDDKEKSDISTDNKKHNQGSAIAQPRLLPLGLNPESGILNLESNTSTPLDKPENEDSRSDSKSAQRGEEDLHAEPGIDFLELREYYNEHFRPEGPLAGFAEFKQLRAARAFPGMSVIYHDLGEREKAQCWNKGYAPSLAKYFKERTWLAPVTQNGGREQSRQSQFDTQSQVEMFKRVAAKIDRREQEKNATASSTAHGHGTQVNGAFRAGAELRQGNAGNPVGVLDGNAHALSA